MSLSPEAQQAAAFLDGFRRQADERLRELLTEREAALGGLPFETDRYHALLREYALRGGKRVRGALVSLAFEAVSGRPAAEALDASLAFELAHVYLLAFDDFMDHDELRRGGPALHVLAAREARERGCVESEHRGVSVSLLLGLSAQSLAFDLLLTRAPREADVSLAAWYFNTVLDGVTTGQLLDVVAVDAPSRSLADVREIHRRKTGLYTTEGPVVLGAILAGARLDDARLCALAEWAAPVGEAFQLVDDVLGVTGDPAATGKGASGDLREGKWTAVQQMALERLSPLEREELRSLVGRPLNEAEMATARSLIEKSGALAAVRARAQALELEGRRALEGKALASDAATLIRALGRLVVERDF